MGRRSKSAARCSRCRLHEDSCVCDGLKPLHTGARLALVIHHRELRKPTATGPLAAAALTNSEVHVHGLEQAPLDLRHLHDDGRRVLVLFPSEHARPLNVIVDDDDPRPITLVVPDGNWRQATRIPTRVPGLADAERVTLPPDDNRQTTWGVRRETRAAGLSTFEAIARALGILESKAVEDELQQLFETVVRQTLAARGSRRDSPPATGVDDDDDEATAPLDVLFRDEHLVAINKPSGMLVHRGWAREGVVALQRLRDQIGAFVYPVHRLDRATSGVVIFALSSQVARDLQARFNDDSTRKRYLALCRGRDPALRRIEHALRDEDKDRDTAPRAAVTDVRLLGAFERYGLYEALPKTGRTHQIRRHFKHASHHIVGDVRYGKGEHNRLFRDRYGFSRLALHCQRIELDHPRRDERLTIEAPLPDDLDALFAALDLRGLV